MKKKNSDMSAVNNDTSVDSGSQHVTVSPDSDSAPVTDSVVTGDKTDDKASDLAESIARNKSEDKKRKERNKNSVPFDGVNQPETLASSDVDGDNIDLPEGFEKAPAVSNKSVPVVSKEVTDNLFEINRLFKSNTRNCVAIGYYLQWFQMGKGYKELGYKTFPDFAKKAFGLGSSAAYNYINLCIKFSEYVNNEPTPALSQEFERFSTSQLVAMLDFSSEEISKIDENTTVRDIKRLAGAYIDHGISKDPEPEKDESEESSDSVDSSDNKKSSAKSARDSVVAMQRISMGSVRSWDDLFNDKDLRKACEYYLSDDRRTADGKDYRIEVVISYPDTSV
jgi:hypothetical protein